MDMLKDIYRFLKSQGWRCRFYWLGLSWTKNDFFNCSIKLTWSGLKYFALDTEVSKSVFIEYIGYEPFGMCPDTNFLMHVIDMEDQAYRDSDREYLSKREIVKYIQSHWHEYK